MTHATKLLIALSLLGTAACSGSIDAGNPQLEPKSAEIMPANSGLDVTLHVWSHEAYLRELATSAAARIRVATGIVVAVAPTPLTSNAVELRWTNDYVEHFNGRWMGALQLSITLPEPAREPVLVHELLHALGAEHVEQGAGILSPSGWAEGFLTTADLESVCAASEACLWMTPEQ